MVLWVRHLLNEMGDWLRESASNPVRRLQVTLLTLLLLIVYGTLGYMLLADMTLTEAVYMTAITITTIGFGEIRPLDDVGRLFTITVIIFGVGIATTAITEGIRIALEPVVWLSLQRRRMGRQLMAIENHYIICGYGRVGRQVLRDFRARHVPCVIVDNDPENEQRLLEDRVAHVIGDATREEALMEAGIKRARGLVSVLTNDADNIMTVLTARLLNPNLKIVARVVRQESEKKLRLVGADQVINPYQIGGHRLALSLLRPVVNEFLHRIYHFDESPYIDIGQLLVLENSQFAGQTVQACEIRTRHQVNILAIQQTNGQMLITPAPDYILRAGETLVIIGPSERVYQLESQNLEI